MDIQSKFHFSFSAISFTVNFYSNIRHAKTVLCIIWHCVKVSTAAFQRLGLDVWRRDVLLQGPVVPNLFR